MKKIILILLCLSALGAKAQTAKELLGKWQLVKWVKADETQDIVSYFKTDKVYQVFLDDNKFQGIVGEKVNKGKWKLSDDNTELTINAGIIPVKFKVDVFTADKRVVSMPSLGSFEYKKVTE